MMNADIMGTYPTNELVAAREKFAQPERTVANELPQELSRLSGLNGCHGVNSFLKGVASAAQGGGGKRNGRPMQATAVPKSRQRAVTTTVGFSDDSHPTILAAARG